MVIVKFELSTDVVWVVHATLSCQPKAVPVAPVKPRQKSDMHVSRNRLWSNYTWLVEGQYVSLSVTIIWWCFRWYTMPCPVWNIGPHPLFRRRFRQLNQSQFCDSIERIIQSPRAGRCRDGRYYSMPILDLNGWDQRSSEEWLIKLESKLVTSTLIIRSAALFSISICQTGSR